MKSSAKKVELASVDDLFSTEESRADAQRERVLEIPLSELHPFKNHPFKVKDDESMMETADSIRQYGVLVPAIARPDPDGGYEFVMRHKKGFLLVGAIFLLICLLLNTMSSCSMMAQSICVGIVYISGLVLGLISMVIALLGVAGLLTCSLQNGIILLVMAFLISPFGLPLAAIWLLGKVQDLKFLIQDLVYG